MKEPRQTTPVEWGLIVALTAVAAYVLLEWLRLPARSIMIAAGVLSVMGGAWVALAYATATIAKRKGYSFRKYFALTLVGGFLALAGVLALPKLAGGSSAPR